MANFVGKFYKLHCCCIVREQPFFFSLVFPRFSWTHSNWDLNLILNLNLNFPHIFLEADQRWSDGLWASRSSAEASIFRPAAIWLFQQESCLWDFWFPFLSTPFHSSPFLYWFLSSFDFCSNNSINKIALNK